MADPPAPAPPSIAIRPFQPKDADRLADIYRAAVAQLADGDYAPEQIAAWLSVAPPAAAFSEMYGDGRAAFVAIMPDGRLAGFSDLEGDGHIQFLYVAPEAAGRGVARALIGRLEAAAREAGLERMYAEASETALPVFLGLGFAALRRRDFTIADVAIHNHAVERRLRARSSRDPGLS